MCVCVCYNSLSFAVISYLRIILTMNYIFQMWSSFKLATVIKIPVIAGRKKILYYGSTIIIMIGNNKGERTL